MCANTALPRALAVGSGTRVPDGFVGHRCALLNLKVEELGEYARWRRRCLEAGAIVECPLPENGGGDKFRCGSEDRRDRV